MYYSNIEIIVHRVSYRIFIVRGYFICYRLVSFIEGFGIVLKI